MNSEIRKLKEITYAKYQKQQQSFQRLIVEENRLRQELERLKSQLAASRLSEHNLQLEAIGADVLWQGWVGRKTAELNLKLVQILAIKEHHLAQVRQAYGKYLVTLEIFETASSDAKRKTARANLERAVEISLSHQR